MKIKHILLALSAVLIVAQTQRPASAGDARFHFAPNVWKSDQPVKPVMRAVEAPHVVTNGAVPASSRFLGVDPAMLQKPAPPPPPVVIPQVAAQPSFAQIAPQMAMPKSPFNPAFGAPPGMHAREQVAHLPAPATPPQAKAGPAGALPLKASKPVVAHHASTSVHGVLSRHKTSVPEGLVANAGKRIDSYGSGYVPGPFVPTAVGDGSRTQTDVHGTLLRHGAARR